MEINIGINERNRKAIAAGLSKLLADSYILFLKTHNYHWNVTEPMFQTLHTMFEAQYTELFTAVDEIAERIRALGEKPLYKQGLDKKIINTFNYCDGQKGTSSSSKSLG